MKLCCCLICKIEDEEDDSTSVERPVPGPAAPISYLSEDTSGDATDTRLPDLSSELHSATRVNIPDTLETKLQSHDLQTHSHSKAQRETTTTEQEELSEDDTDMKSSSDWRKEGNASFATVTDNLCPSIKQDRMQNTLKCYQNALNKAINAEDKSSAAKNLGMAYWKMANITQQGDGSFTMWTNYYSMSLELMNDACMHGEFRTLSWKTDLECSVMRCFSELIDNYSVAPTKQRITVMENTVSCIGMPHIRFECYLELSKLVFHSAVVTLSYQDPIDSIRWLSDGYTYIEHAKIDANKGLGEDAIQRIKEMEDDIFINMCVAESIKARLTGDQLLVNVMQDEEDVNIEMVWEIIDWYKQAILLSHEKCIEMESIALSRIGKVYEKVLKLETRAKDNYVRCIQLAHSLFPRNFGQEDWYKDASQGLEKFQKKTVREEDAQKDKARAEILNELVSEMKLLDLHKDDFHVNFLQFIYKEFPPPNTAHKLEGIKDKMEHDELKKILQKAVIHYHPDRVTVEVHGKKKKVLFEEITKRLTSRYEKMK